MENKQYYCTGECCYHQVLIVTSEDNQINDMICPACGNIMITMDDVVRHVGEDVPVVSY
jgi:hypothetical protein